MAKNLLMEEMGEKVWFISASGYYQPKVRNRPENRERVTDYELIIKSPDLSRGDYIHFVYCGIRLELRLPGKNDGDQEIRLTVLSESHWANSQNWHYNDIDPKHVPAKNTFFVNEEDVYKETLEILQEQKIKKQKKKEKGRVYFQKAIDEAKMIGINQKIAHRIVRKNNVAVLKTVTELKVNDVNKEQALRVSQRAQAWKYASDCLDPGVIFPRRLEDLRAACLEYHSL